MLFWKRRTKTSCAVTLVRTCMAGFQPDCAVHVYWALTGKMLPMSPCSGFQRGEESCVCLCVTEEMASLERVGDIARKGGKRREEETS